MVVRADGDTVGRCERGSQSLARPRCTASMARRSVCPTVKNRAHFRQPCVGRRSRRQGSGTQWISASQNGDVDGAALAPARRSVFRAYMTDERQYAKALWSSIPERSLVLLDREYLDAAVLQGLSTTDRHWMTPAKSSTQWRVIETLSERFAVEMTTSSEARKKHPHLPTHFDVRTIRYQRRRLPTAHVVDVPRRCQTVPSRRSSASSIASVGRSSSASRRALKTDMLQRLEAIRSRRPDTVAQELWGLFLAYNLIRLEMERVADGPESHRLASVSLLRCDS